MCDEYDEERMWAYWRRLELQEQLRREDHKTEEVDVPLAVSPLETVDGRKTRPRVLTH